MTELADRIGAVVATTETELAAAQERRAGLVRRAHGNDDPKAKQELAELADRIAELEQRLDDARLAAVGVERQAQAAAEQDAAEERVRLEAEGVRLEAELRTLIDDVQRGARVVGERAQAALDVADALADVRTALGVTTGWRSVGTLLGDLVQLRSKDECSRLAFEPVRAYTRGQLLAEYPLDEPAEDDVDKAGRQCSVCSHEAADEIQAGLDAGRPLRELESKYGVSRSALSRHRAHG